MSEGLDPAFFDEAGHDYGAVLVVSFGGPEGPDDVMPFLENVFRGLRVTDETKQRIAERYQAFGGVSPINAHTRDFIEALKAELQANGPRLPIYWGNRNWEPLLPDTIRQMAADGIQRACVYVTSTFSSYSGCRKYREDLFEAVQGVTDAPHLDKLRVGFNHPGFIAASSARVEDALALIPKERRADATVLFTAHSLPESMAANSPYVEQLLDCCASIAATIGRSRSVSTAATGEHALAAGRDQGLALPGIHDCRLVFQSNNARYGGEPWLGPDIAEALTAVHAAGNQDVVVAPIGFVCDHMEVVLDLDVDARAHADQLGLNMVRAGTVGTHPQYIDMVRELIVERASTAPARRVEGRLPAKHDFCPADCCLSGRPGPPKPALCGADETAYGHEVIAE